MLQQKYLDIIEAFLRTHDEPAVCKKFLRYVDGTDFYTIINDGCDNVVEVTHDGAYYMFVEDDDGTAKLGAAFYPESRDVSNTEDAGYGFIDFDVL